MEGDETVEPASMTSSSTLPDFTIASSLAIVLGTMTTSIPVSLVNGS